MNYIKTMGAGRYKLNIEFFDSTLELVDTCKTRTITNSQFDDMEKKRSYDKSWYGVKSYKEALDLMNDGWSEQVETLKKEVGKIEKTQVENRITYYNNVVGFAPIVPLALSRVPNSMIDARYRPVRSKVLSIYYSMTINCGNEAEQIIENGKKLVSAIVLLEKMGYRIALNIVQDYCSHQKGDMLVINVKKPTQPLDLKRICFPAMSPAMFRVIGFDWYSKFPRGTYRSGYGHSLHTDCEDLNELAEITTQMFGKDAMYISAELIQDKGVDYIVKILQEGKYE